MDWISRHASEILVAVLTALIIKGLDYLLARRAKVVFFYTSAAQFHFVAAGNVAGGIANTITLALWNTGRAAAEDIRIVHAHLPDHYQIWPPMIAAVNLIPSSGHRELVIPRILPRQIIYISYLDAVPLSPAMIVQLNAKDHQVEPMPFQFTRVFPAWIRRTLFGLLIVGTVVTVRYLYVAGVAILRWLFP
jgi:hypothetical protein